VILSDSDFDRFKELVEDPQIDLNKKSEELDGRTPLMLLCSRQTNKETEGSRLLDGVEFLLKNKEINVHKVDNYGDNALTLLCKHYQGDDLIDVMRLLTQREINVTLKTKEDESTALLNLCQYYEGKNLKEAVRLLIDSDVTVLEAKNSNGANALTLLLSRHISQQNLHKDFAIERAKQLLIKKGCSPSILNPTQNKSTSNSLNCPEESLDKPSNSCYINLSQACKKLPWCRLWAAFLWKFVTSFYGFIIGDILLLYNYFENEKWWYFWFTFAFLFLPAFVISCLNWKYYWEKFKVNPWIKIKECNLKDKLVEDPEWKFYFRSIFCFLLISPLAR
jgi:hypothetical protein